MVVQKFPSTLCSHPTFLLAVTCSSDWLCDTSLPRTLTAVFCWVLPQVHLLHGPALRLVLEEAGCFAAWSCVQLLLWVVPCSWLPGVYVCVACKHACQLLLADTQSRGCGNRCLHPALCMADNTAPVLWLLCACSCWHATCWRAFHWLSLFPQVLWGSLLLDFLRTGPDAYWVCHMVRVSKYECE